MKIYTKRGDQGETSLWGGQAVPKDDLRIQAYGTLDELNSVLGLAVSLGLADPLAARVRRLQDELFRLGAEMATPRGKSTGIVLVGEVEITRLEREIDEMEATLTPLKTFILPGGDAGSSALHVARTVSRRAERELVRLHRQDSQRSEALIYLNRLSDHLFVCARAANLAAGRADTPWIAPR